MFMYIETALLLILGLSIQIRPCIPRCYFRESRQFENRIYDNDGVRTLVLISFLHTYLPLFWSLFRFWVQFALESRQLAYKTAYKIEKKYHFSFRIPRSNSILMLGEIHRLLELSLLSIQNRKKTDKFFLSCGVYRRVKRNHHHHIPFNGIYHFFLAKFMLHQSKGCLITCLCHSLVRVDIIA